MKKKMAIISSTNFQSYPMGGMMSFILDSLEQLSEEYEITLWGVHTTSNYEQHIIHNEKKYKFKSFSKVITGKKIIPNLIRVIYNIYKNKTTILREEYDILYIHGIPLSYPFFRSKPKLVNHIHGLPNPFSLNKSKLINNFLFINLYEKYRSKVIKESNLIFLASDKLAHKKFTKKYSNYKNKIHYIPNFADDKTFKTINKQETRNSLRIADEDTIFVSTGRLSIGKDFNFMIDSFHEYLNDYNKQAKLIIIGDGDMKDELETKINKLGLEKNILLLGRLSREEIKLWLNSSDIFLFTSKAEGYPISLAEAAMCSLPIVSMDIDGVHDLVINKKTGYLCNNRNINEYSELINKAYENKKTLSDNIYKLSNQFTSKSIIENIINYLRKL